MRNLSHLTLDPGASEYHLVLHACSYDAGYICLDLLSVKHAS
jgi:hypothetical protein